MRKILTLILSVIAINTAFAQSFGTTAEIINSDCRIQFNNTNGTKIFELIGENLTWWRQSNNSIVIRDKVTQVTIASTYTGTPAFAALDDSLDAWIVACKDCCSGGSSGGGSSQGTDLIQFSDGSGGFYGLDTVIDELGTLYYGIGENIGTLKIGVDNSASGEASLALGFQDTASGSFSLALQVRNKATGLGSLATGSENQANGILSFAAGDGNVVNRFAGVAFGQHSITTMVNDTIFDSDTVFAYGNGPDEFNESNALTLQRNGNLSHSGAYANTSYVIYTGGDSDTIPDNTSTYIYNPAATVASKTITLPSNPLTGQVLNILAGGTITAGDVITSFTLDGNGRTIIGDVCSKLRVNEMVMLKYIDSGINTWYVLSQCK